MEDKYKLKLRNLIPVRGELEYIGEHLDDNMNDGGVKRFENRCILLMLYNGFVGAFPIVKGLEKLF